MSFGSAPPGNQSNFNMSDIPIFPRLKSRLVLMYVAMTIAHIFARIMSLT